MGLVLSLIAAIIESAKSLFAKKSTKTNSALFTTWAWQVTSLIILLPALLYFGIPDVNTNFWVYSVIKSFLMGTALILYNYSLKKTDISLALPMLALTPLVTSFMSYILSGEYPSKMGGFGILVIVVGLYLLNKKDKSGFLDPFKEAFANKGMFSMFLVSIIWGVSTSVEKVAVVNGSPAYFAVVSTLITSTLLTPIVLYHHRDKLRDTFKINRVLEVLPVGIMDGVLVIVQATAYTLTLAAYVIAIKRTSILISALLANIFFKEKIKDRIFPILIMLCGLLLIILS